VVVAHLKWALLYPKKLAAACSILNLPALGWAREILPRRDLYPVVGLRGCADKMTERMKIQINGQDRDCSLPLSLDGLLVQLGMKADRVAVELNRRIVPREDWPSTTLKEGDRLEIVHFVGGGVTG